VGRPFYLGVKGVLSRRGWAGMGGDGMSRIKFLKREKEREKVVNCYDLRDVAYDCKKISYIYKLIYI
jgi:hypothetical protein